MAKRKFKTWALAEEAHDRVAKDAGVLQMALTDVLRNRVDWIQQNVGLRIGVSRLDSPHGGLVILEENGYAGAHYLEDWVSRMLRIPAPSMAHKDDYEQWVRMYDAAHEAKRRQHAVHQTLLKKARMA